MLLVKVREIKPAFHIPISTRMRSPSICTLHVKSPHLNAFRELFILVIRFNVSPVVAGRIMQKGRVKQVAVVAEDVLHQELDHLTTSSQCACKVSGRGSRKNK